MYVHHGGPDSGSRNGAQGRNRTADTVIFSFRRGLSNSFCRVPNVCCHPLNLGGRVGSRSIQVPQIAYTGIALGLFGDIPSVRFRPKADTGGADPESLAVSLLLPP